MQFLSKIVALAVAALLFGCATTAPPAAEVSVGAPVAPEDNWLFREEVAPYQYEPLAPLDERLDGVRTGVTNLGTLVAEALLELSPYEAECPALGPGLQQLRGIQVRMDTAADSLSSQQIIEPDTAIAMPVEILDEVSGVSAGTQIQYWLTGAAYVDARYETQSILAKLTRIAERCEEG